MCGIPGAGKSTFVEMNLTSGDFPSDAHMFNPDKLMTSLARYQNDASMHGAQTAYETWELPARDMAFEHAHQALNDGLDIIKDMGGANPLSFDIIKKAKKQGYQIKIYYIYCNTHEAFRRINQRDFKISQQEVINRQRQLESLLPQYKIIADNFIMMDNTNLDTPFKIVA